MTGPIPFIFVRLSFATKLEGQTLLKETMGNPSRCNVRFLGMIEG